MALLSSIVKKITGWGRSPYAEEAETIVTSAKRCADAILARREELDRQGRADEPLVVLLGEHHNRPAHYVHHLAVIDRLLDKTKDIAVLTEMPHNSAPKLFRKKTSHKDDDSHARLKEKDRRGELSLKSALAWKVMPLGNHSTAMLFHALLRRNVPICFSDTAKTPADEIDSSDPSTARSLKACFGKAAGTLPSTKRAGMYVRNHHMLRKIAEFAEETKARIIVQRVGNSHLMGRMREKESRSFDGPHSLAAMCKRVNLPVLAFPIMSSSFTAEDIPSNHGLDHGEWMAVENLSDIKAQYKGIPDPQLQEGEAVYVNGLLKEAGLQDDTLSMDEYHSKRDDLQEEMQEVFHSLKPKKTPRRKPSESLDTAL